MLIREREYEACGQCGSRKLVREEAYGCDTCRKQIDLAAMTDKRHRAYLDATVFPSVGESRHMHFCSWACALTGLSRVKCDYFITLPFVTYDETVPGLGAKAFWRAVREFGASRARRARNTKRLGARS